MFIILREWVKNGESRLVALNDLARSEVERERGELPTHVFIYRGHPGDGDVQRRVKARPLEGRTAACSCG